MILTARFSLGSPSMDERAHVRWNLQLTTELEQGANTSDAILHDITENGFKLQTGIRLGVGDAIAIRLREEEPSQATVVWKDDGFYGCAFDTPISVATLGSLLLQAPIDKCAAAHPEEFQEVIVGRNPGVDVLQEWKAEFDEKHKPKGHFIIGFRSRSDGTIIAIIGVTS